MKESIIKKDTGIDDIGLHHVSYSSYTGSISLVYPHRFTMNRFEIYSFNNLFEDVERYDTLKEAEARIDEVLDVNYVNYNNPEEECNKDQEYYDESDHLGGE